MELDQKGENTMIKAKRAYEAYCNYTGNKSLVTGADLPKWEDLKGSICNAWFAAAKAVEESTDLSV